MIDITVMGTPLARTCADDGFRAARTGVHGPIRTHSTHPTKAISTAQRKKPRRKTLRKLHEAARAAGMERPRKIFHHHPPLVGTPSTPPSPADVRA